MYESTYQQINFKIIGNLLQVFLDVLDGKDPELKWRNDLAAVGVVVASNGYPSSYKKEVPLPDLTTSKNPYIIHAGTKRVANNLVSDGGRVLLVGAVETSKEQATKVVYQKLSHAFDKIEGFFYRTDI